MAAMTATSIKWKHDKPAQAKRDAPTVLEPLGYTPVPKEDIDAIQLSKKPNRDGSKHVKPRPVVLESLGPPTQFEFGSQQHQPEQPEPT